MFSMMPRLTVPVRRRNRLPSRRISRFCHYSFMGFLALGMLGGSTNPPRQMPATAAPVLQAGAIVKVAANETPMDEPLRLVAKARESYSQVRDYSCTMIKRERIEGKLQPDNVISMKVRAEPFAVSLKWQEPRALMGQEACYVLGRNGGKIRAKAAGALGFVGFVSLDANDPRVRKTSRHSITESGLGNLLQQLSDGWALEKRLNQTLVQIAEYTMNQRPCIRVETTHPIEASETFPFHRTVVYFDKEHNLPVRVECYDYPRFEGDPGEIVEMYSYLNLEVNVGLGDDAFVR